MTRAVVLAVLFLLTACAPAVPSSAERIETLSGWREDQVEAALPALRASCAVWAQEEPETKLVPKEAGTIGDWKKPCARFMAASEKEGAALRRIFEEMFEARKIEGQGFFTGYYEPVLRGARRRHGVFQTPVWARPRDLILVNTALFSKEGQGPLFWGKKEKGNLLPYDTRAQIAGGSLRKRAKPLFWAEDPVDVFFLESQGSGYVVFEDGSRHALLYDGQNGRPYTLIGPDLLARGLIDRPAGAEKIRSWLKAHPREAGDIMNKNESVVFFKMTKDKATQGTQGVALTPRRSFAVDPRFISLGLPLWLETPAHQRLVVAQDTGGAIKGPVRGDLFWGSGEAVREAAGAMQERGTLTLLLPKKEPDDER